LCNTCIYTHYFTSHHYVFVDTLLSSPEVFAVSPEEELQLRARALRSLCPVLRLHTVMPWNRAVGRILDVGPSQLHLFFALHQLYRLQSSDIFCDDYVQVLAEAAPKMKPQHVQVLLLRVAGVSAGRVEELKKVSLAPLESQDILLSLRDTEQLLGTLLDLATRQVGAASDKSTARATSRVSKGEEGQFSAGELDQLKLLSGLLLRMRCALSSLPMDLQLQALDRPLAAPALAADIVVELLAQEDVESVQAKAACDALLQGNAELARILNRAVGAEEEAQPFFSCFCQALQRLSAARAHGDAAETFRVLAAQMRSLIDKAAVCLLSDELCVFVDAVLESLASLKAVPTEVVVPAWICGIAWGDEGSWLTSGILQHNEHNSQVFASIHVLSRAIEQLIGIGQERRERVVAVQRLLICRYLLAALQTTGALTVEELEALPVCCPGGGPSATAGYDITSSADWDQLLENVLSAAGTKLSAALRGSTPGLVALMRLQRCVEDAALASASFAFVASTLEALGGSGPVEPSRPTEFLQMDRHMQLLRVLLAAQDNAGFVEYVLLDMRGSRTLEDDGSRAGVVTLVNELPANSSWQRQVELRPDYFFENSCS
jgi:hypothetical protein